MKLIPIAVAGAFSLASLGAMAATDTGTLAVSAKVTESCAVGTIAPLGFGDYDAVSAVGVDASSTIEVTCSNGADYEIGLDGGLTGDTAVRQMVLTDGVGETLDYLLSVDAAHATNWGDTLATDTLRGLTGDGLTQTHTVYGRIAAGQNVAVAGDYTDTVTVTVHYAL